MKNGPFEDVFPIEDGDIPLYSIAMLVYQWVTVKSSWDQIALNLMKNSGCHSEHFSSTHTGLEQTLQGAPKQIVRTSTEAVANAGLGVGQKQ